MRPNIPKSSPSILITTFLSISLVIVQSFSALTAVGKTSAASSGSNRFNYLKINRPDSLKQSLKGTLLSST